MNYKITCSDVVDLHFIILLGHEDYCSIKFCQQRFLWLFLMLDQYTRNYSLIFL